MYLPGWTDHKANLTFSTDGTTTRLTDPVLGLSCEMAGDSPETRATLLQLARSEYFRLTQRDWHR